MQKYAIKQLEWILINAGNDLARANNTTDDLRPRRKDLTQTKTTESNRNQVRNEAVLWLYSL